MPITLIIDQVSVAEFGEPHRRIQAVGGLVGEAEWNHTQAQAIEHIEGLLFSYYLFKDASPVRLVVGMTAAGEKFLKTTRDGDIPELLMQLPSIPTPRSPC